MLSIGMLAAGDEDYYLSVGSAGPVRADEYYREGGQTPGEWMGGGAGTLDLHGDVTAADLRAVLAGVDPRLGVPLVSGQAAQGRRRPGLFLTFSAPKGVSLLGALGDRAVADAVDGAHRAAVGDALGYLEDNALFARRGRGGVQRVATGGFVAAGFVHRTSRAGDPQLHTHVLAANLVQGTDGGWSAPDSRTLFRHARTAGFVYQAALRHYLTVGLGLGWGAVRAGMAEPAGIDPATLRRFSTRRVEIEGRLAETGETTARAAQVAAYRTRTAKDTHLSAGVLRASWELRAGDAGLTRDALDALTGPGRTPEALDVADLADRLTGPGGLTAKRSTFERRDAVRAVAEAAPDGIDRRTLERTVDLVLADPRVLLVTHQPTPTRPDPTPPGPAEALPEGRPGGDPAAPERPAEARHTTRDMWEAEARVLSGALARRRGNVAVVAPGVRDRVLGARPGLSDEQARAVERLLADGDGVSVLVGRAGTGKTFALDAARDGWQEAGLRVVGAAPSARAAAELQAGSGIPSTTLARLLLDAERPPGDGGGLPSGGVVVVDEAGMAGTRTLDRLLATAARDRAKVVLVGDPAQLPEIDAGGTLRALAARLDAPELTVNRRQAEVWERDALDRLRSGRPAAAVAIWRDHGRLVLADTAADARQALVGDWWEARQAGADAGMYALRRSDVDALNRLARRLHGEAGRLGGEEIEVGGRCYAVGDEIVALRNHRLLGLTNGTRGTVTAVDLHGGSLMVRAVDGRDIHVPSGYLQAGLVDHAYALTLHKAQGVTVDRAFLLGSDRLFREAGYVGMSRGRAGNDLYLVAGTEPDPDSHTRPERRSGVRNLPTAVETGQDGAIRTLVESLDRSHAQHLAAATGVVGPGPGRPLADLPAAREPAGAYGLGLGDERRRLLRRAALADPGAHLAPLGPPPAGGVARIRWSDAAMEVDAYRDRYRVTDPARMLGAVPAFGTLQAEDHARARMALRVAAAALDRPDPFAIADDRRLARDERADERGWSR
ncbi:relaxase domain-containing protein [Acidiferrimicrobium sp. IK]|uniref:MobF family relaxase n=1 Tax=Acidiferrimicrobium sp. IK TaxID=2871700 RepID=UPI0021CB9133|nr:MobF family relaxase [Acidiferrimicrobium sp. IK]MCU4187221.1 relaxase domain-containing protein [Acidiferrimicrobium sp. IK]